MKFACRSHVGMIRQRNEDHFSALPDIGCFAVFDGMGGHGGGDVASQLASATFSHAMAEGKGLEETLARCNQVINKTIEGNSDMPDMGATAVAIRLSSGKYQLVWAGDSRIYQLPKATFGWGSMERLTKDHSFVQGLIDRGVLSEEEAEQHPDKNSITSCLGGGKDSALKIDYREDGFWRKCRFLLCSDGLTAVVKDADIEAVLKSGTDLEAMADQLINMTLEGGAPDNVTLILIEADGRL